MVNINIADIARAAQVSPATVTRVINNSGYVSAQKRKIVLETIDTLGYIPNRMASSLRMQKSNFVGHVLPVSSENPFFARIGNAFTKAAEQAGYHVLTAVTNMDAAREKSMVESLVSLMVEAIVFTADTASDTDTISWVLSRGIPVVMIERPRQISNIDVILMDHFQASWMATEHMLKKGHRKIGFIGRQFENHEVEYQRFHGFESAIQSYGLEADARWIKYTTDYSTEDGRQAMEELLKTGDLPTALLVASDVTACGVLQVLYENHLRVPDDISLVGYDNTLSASSTPPLTSIELQPDQIGTAAVSMISERKSGERIGAKTITLSPVLVDRGSVRVL